MDKAATVILKFNGATDGHWLEFLKSVDKKEVEKTDNTVFASIQVKSYSLTDHQFVQVKLNMGSGKEIVALIPRSIVMTILEGKSDLAKSLYFAGGTSKP